MHPTAVTFDFHNTLACCDEWFQLEIRGLLPAFLQWQSRQDGSTLSTATLERSVELYRKLRLEIMEHGVEQDAATCINLVTRELGFEFDTDTIERGLHDVMHACLDDCRPMAGVVAAVRALREQDIKLGVISSAVYHPFLDWSLEKFGIRSAFDIVVTSASCGFYKSRAEIYEFTLDTLEVTPGSTIHVGDSYLYDVQTAGKIGIGTVWLDLEREAGDSKTADVVVHTLEGVDRVLLNGYMERIQ